MGAAISSRVEMATRSPRSIRASSIFVAAAVLLLWLPCLLFIGARLVLPGDGAQVVIDHVRAGTTGFVVQPLDSSTGLHAGDLVVAVGGHSTEAWLRDIAARGLAGSPASQGDRLHYTVLREGRLERLALPLVPFPLMRALMAESTVFLFLFYFQALGLFVFFRRPGQVDAQLFVLISSAIFVNGTVFNLGMQASDVLNPWLIALWMWGTVVMNGLMLPLTLHFSLVFPRRQILLERHPWVLGLIYSAVWLIYLAFIAAGGIGAPSAVARFFLLVRGTTAMLACYLILIVASWTHSYFTACNRSERRQLRWILWGMAIGQIPFLLLSVIPAALGVAQAVNAYFELIGLLLCAIPTTTMIAILRAGLFDIDLIIRRTLVYSLLTTVLLVIYVGSVVVFQYIVRLAVGQTSDVAIIASTILVASAFAPLRRSIQREIDRRFYRARYNAEQALAAFSVAMRDRRHADLEQLTEELVDVIDETMHPASVSLWLRDPARAGSRPAG
jgi:hypothetical protein